MHKSLGPLHSTTSKVFVPNKSPCVQTHQSSHSSVAEGGNIGGCFPVQGAQFHVPLAKTFGQLKKTTQSSSSSTQLKTLVNQVINTHHMRLIHYKYCNEMERCCDVWHALHRQRYIGKTWENNSLIDKTCINTLKSRTFGCSEPPAFSNRG